MTNLPSCKVVLIGEPGVGKSSIISRYFRGTFSETEEPSTTASYISQEIYIEKFKCHLRLDVWDTAGQEKYRSLTKFFYKEADIAIMVYDITNKKSFIEVSNYWIDQLNECCSNELIIGIAGNKNDLFDKEQITEQEVKEFAHQINAVFQLTSARNGFGIDKLFINIGEKYLDNNISLIPAKNKGEHKINLKKQKNDHEKKKHDCCNNK